MASDAELLTALFPNVDRDLLDLAVDSCGGEIDSAINALLVYVAKKEKEKGKKDNHNEVSKEEVALNEDDSLDIDDPSTWMRNYEANDTSLNYVNSIYSTRRPVVSYIPDFNWEEEVTQRQSKVVVEEKVDVLNRKEEERIPPLVFEYGTYDLQTCGLPYEMWIHIWSWLPLASMLEMMLVCKHWYSLTQQQDSVWESQCIGTLEKPQNHTWREWAKITVNILIITVLFYFILFVILFSSFSYIPFSDFVDLIQPLTRIMLNMMKMVWDCIREANVAS